MATLPLSFVFIIYLLNKNTWHEMAKSQLLQWTASIYFCVFIIFFSNNVNKKWKLIYR